jgi:hypothetical protein
MHINDSDYFDYVKNFFGYGNFDSSLYIIGMEEGGGESDHRICSWKGRFEKAPLMDSYEVHKNMPGLWKYYTGDVNKERFQATISKLIRFVVAPYFNYNSSHHKPWLDFQANYFGRILSDTSPYRHCKMELYPVPCKDNKSWDDKYRNIFKCETKKEFRKKIADHRVDYIVKMIRAHKPKIVLMYGGINNIEFEPFWSRIANDDDWNGCRVEMSECDYYTCRSGYTLYMKVAHPCAHIKNPEHYYSEICKVIKSA